MMPATERPAAAAGPPEGAAVQDTFPRLLAGHAARRPDAVAMQEKHYGIWQPLTWKDYARRVADLAAGLAELGVGRGEVVAVIGDNRPEWLITELAAQSVGACVVGVYPTSIGEEIVHILSLARVRVVVAEDQEQVDKLVRLKDRLPGVETVIYYDPRGLERYEEPYLREFTAVEASGRAWAAARPDWLTEQVAAGSPEDVAVICTTSGTTARPKLAELSHANLLSMARSLAELDGLDAKHRYVSFLPFAWIGEQMLAVAAGLTCGFTVSFPEDPATQRADLREIGPDVLFGPPRIWESLTSDVQVRIDEGGRVKRAVFGWAYAVGDRVAERRVRGRPVPPRLRLAHRLAEVAGLRPVRDQLGLARVRRCYTGGAPLGPDVFRFFHAIGVNLKQIYGQTEVCGIAVLHRDDDIRFHTVGRPLPGTELAISDDGEILLRSPAVFRGYHRNPAATADALDEAGWLHTGDAGYLDDGHLVVIDRAKDVLSMPDGTRWSSAFIENKLKFSPYVEEAVVFAGGGDGAEAAAPRQQPARPEITAIVVIDLKTVGAWAEHARLSYTTLTDLAQKPEVYELLAAEVARSCADLEASVRVRRFVLLHKQLDPDDEEITRTRKVRRGVIAERYGDVVAALTRGDAEANVTTTVTYQDGTSVERKIPLRVFDLSTSPPPAQRARRRPVWSAGR